MRITRYIPLIGIVALSITPALYAQRPPAIHGLTGTTATEATIKAEHKLANKLIAGVEGLIVRGGKDALSDLKPGTTVAIRSVVDGDVRVTEGIVSKVDRGDNEITVRYDNGTTENLQLVEGTSSVVVTYSNEAGKKVSRYFKPKS